MCASREKEYGKLSEDQFKKLIGRLPKESAEFDVARTSFTKERFREFFPEGFAWGSVYERPFAEHVALLFMALDDGCKYLDDCPTREFRKRISWWIWRAWGRTSIGINGKAVRRLVHQGALTRARHLPTTNRAERDAVSAHAFRFSPGGERERQCRCSSMQYAWTIHRCPRQQLPTASRVRMEERRAFFLRLRSALKGPSAKALGGIQRPPLFAFRAARVRSPQFDWCPT